jgi:hypothetical protein
MSATMFLVETCRHCSICNTVTPHTRRRFSLALLASFAFALASGELFLASTLPTVLGGFFCLFVALAIFSFDRERMWRIRCDRCRGKARSAIGSTKPGPHSEVFWL